MNRRIHQVHGLLSVGLCLCALTLLAEHVSAAPKVFLLDAARLEQSRARIADPALQPALQQLQRNADAVIKQGPFSVVHKKQVPPSGDKHDYMSLAPYWWPNPATPTSLPYVRRDGERNSKIKQIT